MKRVLALDFDGVIWDSAGECYESGWRAYKELTGRALSEPHFKTGFLKARPLARTGYDFYLLLRLLEEEPERDLSEFPLADFVKMRAEYAQECQDFWRIFYRLRVHHRDAENSTWLSWQRPFPETLKALDQLENKFHGLALATTKDTDSAATLLRTTGREWPVFGKEFSEHKADQIMGISQHFKVEPHSILFIDDLLENLHQVKPTGASLALAGWGYNTSDSREQTKLEGIPVLSQADFAQHLTSFLEASA